MGTILHSHGHGPTAEKEGASVFTVNILIIEEDPTVEALLVEVLRDAGYRVAAADATTYVESALIFKPDIILIGWHPRGNFAQGWRMAQHLEELFPSSVRVLMSTNETVLHEIGQTRRGHSFDAGLLMPFTLNALLSVVKACSRCQNAAVPSTL